MYVKRVLVLLSYVDNLTTVMAGLARYCEKVKERTNGQFTIELEYVDVSKIFQTVLGTSSEGRQIAYVDPAEIRKEKLKGTYHAICLIFNPKFTVGPAVTNPADNENVFQIPTTWIVDSQYSAQYFFGHENSHSDFWKVGLPDKTHYPTPNHPQITPTDDPSDFYIDCLIELKPYWAMLGNHMAEVYFARLAGTQEFGFVEVTPWTKSYKRATDPSDLIILARVYGLDILKNDGSIDFSLAKEISI